MTRGFLAARGVRSRGDPSRSLPIGASGSGRLALAFGASALALAFGAFALASGEETQTGHVSICIDMYRAVSRNFDTAACIEY